MLESGDIRLPKVYQMTVAIEKMTLAQFLAYDDGTDKSYELENGALIDMPSESDINQRIVSFLFAFLLGLVVPSYRIRVGVEIVVSGTRASLRIPDLVVLSEDLATAMEGTSRSIVLMDMPPPLFVVEVVSPNQEKRDYRYKRSEYAARGIAEYWIVDPIAQKVTVLEWVEGLYEERVFTGDDRVESSVLGSLDLTVDRVLQGR
jgi:Uma2 family endonuclease